MSRMGSNVRVPVADEDAGVAVAIVAVVPTSVSVPLVATSVSGGVANDLLDLAASS